MVSELVQMQDARSETLAIGRDYIELWALVAEHGLTLEAERVLAELHPSLEAEHCIHVDHHDKIFNTRTEDVDVQGAIKNTDIHVAHLP